MKIRKNTPKPTPPPKIYELVMSEKFETPGCTFGEVSNHRWTDLYKNGYTIDANHFYYRGNAYTKNDDELVILTKIDNTDLIEFDEFIRKRFCETNHFRSTTI